MIRFTIEKVGGSYQGACYPFSKPSSREHGFLGPVACSSSPSGELYVGGMHESGWGGGNNVGNVVRLRPTGRFPFGIREARACPGGFELEFTGPCNRELAGKVESYTITAYRRVWKGGYATPDSDRHRGAVRAVEVEDGGLRVKLTVDRLQPGFLYEIHTRPLRGDDEEMWPQVAYYTLNVLP